MSRTFSVRRWAGALGILGCLGLAGPASAESLDSIGERIDESATTVRQVESQYVRPVELRRDTALASRLVDGNVRYLLGDWESAAIILVDIVEDPTYRGQPGFNEARFLLAQSLFQMRSFTLARGYFEDIVESNDSEHSLEAARQLLEIAFAMRRYDGLDELYVQLQQRWGGSMSPEIAYVRGKALYFQERFQDAANAFGAVPPDSDLFTRSRYFLGVIDARLGEWDSALSEFVAVRERLEGQATRTEEEEDLLALTSLAEGRVHYEQEAWADAVNSYARVPRESIRFDDALYEIAWTEIREESYREAIGNLELLSLIANDASLVPEAQLLRGDLLLRIEEYDRAVNQFTAVADTYAPVEQELALVLEGRSSPADFFDALVNPDEGTLRMPAIATSWADQDATVDRALQLVRDLADMQNDLNESRAVLAEIDAALNQGGRANVFPTLREGWGLAIEAESGALDAKRALIEHERDLLWNGWSPDVRAEWESLHRATGEIADSVGEMPQSWSAIESRETEVVGEMQALVIDLFRAEQEIQGARSQVESLRALLGGQMRDGSRGQDEYRQLQSELDALSRELEAGQDHIDELQAEIEARQVSVSVSDDVGSAEATSRQMLASALSAEQAFLAGHRAGGSGNFSEIDVLHSRADGTISDARSVIGRLDDLARQQTVQFTGILEDERERLETFATALSEYTGGGSRLAGEVAFGAFDALRQRFSDLTLRANLGIIDVAWRQKEILTDRRSELARERQQSLRALDADFGELLGNE